ncbi:MAG: DUF1080 domain-containing protein [Verrucomicrobiae bacterium]|nr:DUF1080 domain-containing protein [Verrucomicrobiae bacterium]
MMKNLLLTLAVVLSTSTLFADEADPLFDGKSLDGWKAPDMSYWSVADGAITATSTDAHPCDHNQFLVWQGGDIANFELTLKFKIEGTEKANSGVQVRSRIEPDGHVVGYQVDIADPSAPYLGAVYDEKGRKMLANRGYRTVINVDGTMNSTPLTAADPDVAMKDYEVGKWAEYRIRFVDNKLQVFLNGIQTSEVIDHQKEEREMSGVLALQLHSGPPTTVQFKDIQLTKLD